jgi:hypothetical protein
VSDKQEGRFPNTESNFLSNIPEDVCHLSSHRILRLKRAVQISQGTISITWKVDPPVSSSSGTFWSTQALTSLRTFGMASGTAALPQPSPGQCYVEWCWFRTSDQSKECWLQRTMGASLGWFVLSTVPLIMWSLWLEPGSHQSTSVIASYPHDVFAVNVDLCGVLEWGKGKHRNQRE